MPSQIKVDEIKNVAGQYEIKTNTFKGQTTGGSIAVQGEGTATTNLQQGLAKAWVNFDGTGTISARDSFNTASLTDNGTGDYSINYSTAMGNANYSVCALGSNNRWVYYQNSGHTTGLCKVFTKDATPNNAYDAGHVMIQVLGDLA